MNFFGKSTKKSRTTTTTTPTKTNTNDDDLPYRASPSSRAGSRSPEKKPISPSKIYKTSSNTPAPPLAAEPRVSPQKSRNSRVKPGRRSSPRGEIDLNEHPLNWPPEHRSSILSTRSTRSNMSEPMDLDTESLSPSSPTPQTNTPGAFDTPKTNGTKQNGEGPAPPPHKTPTSPPPAAPAPAPTLEDAEAFKAAGNKLYKAGDFKKAIQEYSKAVEAQPTSATYLSNRAAAYIGSGKYRNALEDCLRADELDLGNPKILLRLARVYTSLGSPQDALDTYARIQPAPSAKDVAPAKAMLQHIQVAEDALRDGNTGSMALHALDQADKLLGLGALKPRKWQLMRGEAYLKMGNVNALGDAQNVAMALLRDNNKDPEALVLRGRALYSQGDNPKAIQHFREALNCDPDYKDAVKYLRMVQKLDRMKTDGNEDYKAKRWQQALDKYTEALEVDPNNKGTNSKLLNNRALCRVQLKDYKGAIEDCERAISLDPSYTKAKKTRANALGQSGKWEDAVRELKELQEQEPNDPTLAKDVRNAELELKKSKRKDYYKILGIEKDADENQVKKAYRKVALIHHPDKNPGDDEAAERFKDITEAYETLSDPQKRARYDSGEDLIDPMEAFGGGMGGMGGMGGGMQIDPEILMQMFGQMGGGSGRGGGGFHSFGGGMPGMGRGGAQGFPGGFSFQ